MRRSSRGEGVRVSRDVFTVLVVCTGNINRSALGAVLLETWAHWYLPSTLAAGVRVTSAGLRAPVGSPMGRRTKVIADALGTDGTRHRAAQISEEVIRAADLVLVSSTDQRDAVLGLVPSVVRSTFTIREAGRIAAILPDAPAPQSVEELRARVAALAGNRAAVDRAYDVDIIDPQGKDDEAYRLMTRQEVPPLAGLAHTLFGMPLGEVAAYETAADSAAFSFEGVPTRPSEVVRPRARWRRKA